MNKITDVEVGTHHDGEKHHFAILCVMRGDKLHIYWIYTSRRLVRALHMLTAFGLSKPLKKDKP